MVEPIQRWAAPILDTPAQQSTRGYQAYVVLTLCRMLYTLHTGSVTTKPRAARWALATLDERWGPLIERAWEGRDSSDAEQAASGARWAPLIERAQERPRHVEVLPEEVYETLALIRYTMERSQQVEIPPDDS